MFTERCATFFGVPIIFIYNKKLGEASRERCTKAAPLFQSHGMTFSKFFYLLMINLNACVQFWIFSLHSTFRLQLARIRLGLSTFEILVGLCLR